MPWKNQTIHGGVLNGGVISTTMKTTKVFIFAVYGGVLVPVVPPDHETIETY